MEFIPKDTFIYTSNKNLILSRVVLRMNSQATYKQVDKRGLLTISFEVIFS